MITGIFGEPGAGKTTIIAWYVKRNLKNKKYKHIYTINAEVKGAEQIKWEDLAIYNFTKCLILIDEITLDADNRQFKTFSNGHRDFFIMHRHLDTDIVWVSQNYDKVDIKIRDLTSELWYMHKSVIPILREFTTMKRIYRNMVILENNAELKLGYRFSTLTEALFQRARRVIFRRPLYKMFNTKELLTLEKRQEYENKLTKEALNELWQKNFGENYPNTY